MHNPRSEHLLIISFVSTARRSKHSGSPELQESEIFLGNALWAFAWSKQSVSESALQPRRIRIDPTPPLFRSHARKPDLFLKVFSSLWNAKGEWTIWLRTHRVFRRWNPPRFRFGSIRSTLPVHFATHSFVTSLLRPAVWNFESLNEWTRIRNLKHGDLHCCCLASILASCYRSPILVPIPFLWFSENQKQRNCGSIIIPLHLIQLYSNQIYRYGRYQTSIFVNLKCHSRGYFMSLKTDRIDFFKLSEVVFHHSLPDVTHCHPLQSCFLPSNENRESKNRIKNLTRRHKRGQILSLVSTNKEHK